jgi:phage-related protein
MDNTAVTAETYEHIGSWEIGRRGDLVEIDGDNNGIAVYCFESSVYEVMSGSVEWQSQEQTAWSNLRVTYST